MPRHVSTTSLNNNNYYSKHGVALKPFVIVPRRKSVGEKLHDTEQIKVLSCAPVGTRRRVSGGDEIIARDRIFILVGICVKRALITLAWQSLRHREGPDGRIHKRYANDARYHHLSDLYRSIRQAPSRRVVFKGRSHPYNPQDFASSIERTECYLLARFNVLSSSSS